MSVWVKKLHDFLTLNDRDILTDSGKVSHELAKDLAEKQFEHFEKQRRTLEAQKPSSDFDKEIKRIERRRRRKKDDNDAKGNG